MDEVLAYIDKEAKRIEQLTIRALSYLGEQCVIEAKDRPQDISWYDHTGNLRSSVGYVIVYNGKIVKYSDFKSVKGGTEGSAEGKNFATEIAERYTSGYALIVVAGMSYAATVEAIEGKDVLASAELFARKKLPEMMSKLKSQILKK